MTDQEKQRIVTKGRSEGMWLMTTSLVILAGVALAFALAFTRAVMIPFVLALFIVTIVSPILDLQVLRLKFPRVIAVAVTLVVVIAIIGLMGLLVTDVIGTAVYTADQYGATVGALFQEGYDKFLEVRTWKWFGFLYDDEVADANSLAEGNEPPPLDQPQSPAPGVVELGLTSEGALLITPQGGNTEDKSFQPQVLNLTPEKRVHSFELAPTVDGILIAVPSRVELEEMYEIPIVEPNQPGMKLIDQFRKQILDVLQSDVVANFGFNAVSGTVNVISSAIFVAIFVIFLLSGRNPHIVRQGIYADIDQKIRRYIVTKVAISAVTGVLVWVTLRLLGLPLASVFGILAFLLNFIPSIGSVISTMLPIPIAVIAFQGDIWPILFVILIPGVIQFVMGSLLDPKLMGDGLNLHPVTILLALSFWGLLWGIVGMFLAAPITAAIRIVLMQFDTLKPVGRLLAGELPNSES